jgi:hypothetical protein
VIVCATDFAADDGELHIGDIVRFEQERMNRPGEILMVEEIDYERDWVHVGICRSRWSGWEFEGGVGGSVAMVWKPSSPRSRARHYWTWIIYKAKEFFA